MMSGAYRDRKYNTNQLVLKLTLNEETIFIDNYCRVRVRRFIYSIAHVTNT